MKKLLSGALALACLVAAGFAASAQTAPAPAPTPTATPIVLPSLPPNAATNPYVQAGMTVLNEYLRQQHLRAANNATGEVSYFRRFEMQVKAGSSYRSIHLHQGTVINPRGATIRQGQTVTVSGDGQPDGSLNANTITINQ